MGWIDKVALRRSFNQAAQRYDADAKLQRAVVNRLISCTVRPTPPPTRILDVGSGSGFGAEALARTFPGARVAALDFAQEMLKITRRRSRRADCVCGDFDALPFAPGVFDLAFASSVLHWSGDVRAALSEFRRVLKEGAALSAAIYTEGTLRELRDSWSGIDDHEHTLEFPLPSLLRRLFGEAGMTVSSCRTQTEVVLYDDVGALLESLKRTGVRNLRRDRAGGLTAPSRFKAMKARYRARHASSRRIPASYTITLVSAHCGAASSASVAGRGAA